MRHLKSCKVVVFQGNKPHFHNSLKCLRKLKIYRSIELTHSISPQHLNTLCKHINHHNQYIQNLIKINHNTINPIYLKRFEKATLQLTQFNLYSRFLKEIVVAKSNKVIPDEVIDAIAWKFRKRIRNDVKIRFEHPVRSENDVIGLEKILGTEVERLHSLCADISQESYKSLQ
mmetsp:Transcript_39935/g.35636  ORF Transcript_39935/g.35636 Transcript_39935/m.35636 type:complete len:173 (+) Transcript_39935:186-704(+)